MAATQGQVAAAAPTLFIPVEGPPGPVGPAGPSEVKAVKLVTVEMSPYTMSTVDYELDCDSTDGPITVIVGQDIEAAFIHDSGGAAATNNITIDLGEATARGDHTYVINLAWASADMVRGSPVVWRVSGLR